MTPYEIMLSESQERMLLVVKKGREAEVERDLREVGPARGAHRRRHRRRPAARQGSRHGRRRDSEHRARRRGAGLRPADDAARLSRRGAAARPVARSPPPAPQDALLRAARVADDREQALGLPPVRPHGAHQHASCSPGMGAGVVRVKGTTRALAMSIDGNGRYCYLDPRRGAMLAVAEAARNVACAGARADRRDQLPELRQPRAAGDHVAVRRGGRRASPRRAARSTCRSPAATSASTTRPTARRSIRRPSSASSG